MEEFEQKLFTLKDEEMKYDLLLCIKRQKKKTAQVKRHQMRSSDLCTYSITQKGRFVKWKMKRRYL